MIQLYGNSITAGVPGISYYRYLKKNPELKNNGVGGDTVFGLKNRIASDNICKDDLYIIEIGTNDIMLPYLCALSPQWVSTVKKIEKSGRRISKSIAEFTENFRELLKELEFNKVGIVSMPCIGEDMDSTINIKVDEYNSLIKELCFNANKAYIDFNFFQKKEIGENQARKAPNYFIDKNPMYMITDIALTNIFGLSNYLSSKRKLITTVDGVHLNSSGALLLSKLVNKFISSCG
jgi:lysophospholipase L1-like esterase